MKVARLFVFLSINYCDMEMTMSAPVSFTKNAISELQRLQQETAPGNVLRLGVKGGGCSGLSYILGFDAKKENDDTYEFEGMQFIMDRSHGIYLAGMQIDWSDGLNARGFTFKNPNATKSCGCGTSFAV